MDQGLLDWDETIAEIMYTTQNDGLIREWCVGNYDHEELVLDARAKIFKKGLAPVEVVRFIEDLRGGRGKGLSPSEILSKEGVTTESKGDMLLFCGCGSRESQPETIAETGRIFNHVGIRFQVLQEEPCCGWPLYQLGDLDGAKEFSVTIADRIRASEASTVVVLDADCYRMLLTRTGRFGGDLKGIKVIPVVSLLADWIESGQLTVTRKISDPLTYHDPCALARYCEEVDSPRKILSAILDVELKEMESNRKLANCCGAGGMLTVTRPDLADKVALLRLEEARATGASTLATGCPRCHGTLTRALSSESEAGLHITNLVRLVAIAAGLVE